MPTIELPTDIVRPGKSVKMTMLLSPCRIDDIRWTPGLAVESLSIGSATFDEAAVSEDKFKGAEIAIGANSKESTVTVKYRNDGEEPIECVGEIDYTPKRKPPAQPANGRVKPAQAPKQPVMGSSVTRSKGGPKPGTVERAEVSKHVTITLPRRGVEALYRVCMGQRVSPDALRPCQDTLRKALKFIDAHGLDAEADAIASV